MDFLKEIVKEIGDDFTKVEQDIDETERFIDTGSHIFNSLVSGSIYGGVSSNKITCLLYTSPSPRDLSSPLLTAASVSK